MARPLTANSSNREQSIVDAIRSCHPYDWEENHITFSITGGLDEAIGHVRSLQARIAFFKDGLAVGERSVMDTAGGPDVRSPLMTMPAVP